MRDARQERIWIGVAALTLLIWTAFHLRVATDWDGLAFLLKSDAELWRDPAHLLYPALLRAVTAGGAHFGLDPLTSGKLLSAICLTLVFALVHLILRRHGLSARNAGLSAALLATSPCYLRQGASLEVYLPCLAVLALAYLMAARAQNFQGGVLAALCLAFSAMLHAGAALGFLAILITSTASPRSRLASAGVFATALVAGALVLAMPPLRSLVFELAGSVAGFVPIAAREAGWARIPMHLQSAAQWIATEGPALAVLFPIVLASAVVRPRRPLSWRFGIAAMVPFLIAYAALGVPTLGLLMPALLGWTCLAARALEAAWPRFATGVLAVALVAQVAVCIPKWMAELRTPDPLRIDAEALAAAAPAHAVFLAGPEAQHLRYFTAASVIAIDDIFQAARATGNPRPNPRDVVRDALRLHESRPIYLSQAASERLFAHARVHTPDPDQALANLEAFLLAGPRIEIDGGRSRSAVRITLRE